MAGDFYPCSQQLSGCSVRPDGSLRTVADSLRHRSWRPATNHQSLSLAVQEAFTPLGTPPQTHEHDMWARQIVDERSTDETVAKLTQMGIKFVQPPDIVGVTYNWNLARRSPAWHHFK